MKIRRHKSGLKFGAAAASLSALLVLAPLGLSAEEAKVTVVIHEVNLLPENAKPRPAVLNETIHEDAGVRTGDQSRSELTFADLTITRLSSNTVFSFNKAGRSVHLNSGAMLLRVPKDSGGAQMRTDACSVAISGTTVALEATHSGRNKLYVLEGTARMALHKQPGEWSTVGAGQMLDVPAGANHLPGVQNFDVDDFMSTNPLITDFPPLPSRNLIYAANPGTAPRVYPSTVVSGGPTRPAPPFLRPLPPFAGGGGAVRGVPVQNGAAGGGAVPNGKGKPNQGAGRNVNRVPGRNVAANPKKKPLPKPNPKKPIP